MKIFISLLACPKVQFFLLFKLIKLRASDVNSPVDVNSPLFGFCKFYSTNMENMS